MNLRLHIEIHGQVPGGVVSGQRRGVCVVVMKRDAVDLVVTFLKHLAIPGQVSGHDRITRSAGDELRVRIHDTNLPGRIAGLAAILAGRHVANLPRPVHLVAQTPVPDLVGLRVPMLAPQIAPACAFGDVTVLDIGRGGFGRAGAEVRSKQRLGSNQAAPFDEFISAELIRFDGIPGTFQYRGAVLLGTHAVEPIVTRDEIAARVAHDGNVEFLDLADHVRSEPIRVGQFRAGLVNTLVDGPPQMLKECAEQPAIKLRTEPGRVDRCSRRASGLRVA